MISLDDIVKAIVLISHPVDDWHVGEGEKLRATLAQSLLVYMRRGEFDGTLASAVGCLRLAEYEVDTSLHIPGETQITLDKGIISFRVSRTKQRKKPKVGDTKVVGGKTYVRKYARIDGMQHMRNGKPVFDWELKEDDH